MSTVVISMLLALRSPALGEVPACEFFQGCQEAVTKVLPGNDSPLCARI